MAEALHEDHLVRLSQLEAISQSRRAAASQLYSRIDDWQTRLLRLYPGEFGDPLVADLVVVDIIHASGVVITNERRRVEYSALSYCWGEPVFDHMCKCNGIELPITQNLYDGLQRMRKQERPTRRRTIDNSTLHTYLWVDAICINQEDLEERSIQVSQMMAIFSKARTVKIWLGELEIDPRLPVKELNLKPSILGEEEEYSNDVEILQLQQRTEDLLDLPWFHRLCKSKRAVEFGTETLTKSIATSRGTHSNVPYLPQFETYPVLQEIWAARNLSITCGGYPSIHWDDFQRRLVDIEKLVQVNDNCTGGLSLQSNRVQSTFLRPAPQTRSSVDHGELKNQFLENSPSQETDMINVLRRCAGSVCGDPRDHIYGILGMTRTVVTGNPAFKKFKSPDNVFQVNYSNSVSKVFQDVARYIMKRDESLNILFLSGKFGSDIGDSRDLGYLPSWCPDWRSKTGSKPWLNYCRLLRKSLPQPPRSDGRSSSFLSHVQFMPDWLGLQGIVIGIVSSIDLKEEFLAVNTLPEELRAVCQNNRGPFSEDVILKELNRNLATLSPSKQEKIIAGDIDILYRDFHVLGTRTTLALRRNDLEVWSHKRTPAFPESKPHAGKFEVTTENVLSQFETSVVKHVRVQISSEFEEALEVIRKEHTFDSLGYSVSRDLSQASSGQEFPATWTVPLLAQDDDLILLVRGAFLPIVVRSGMSYWRYVGPATLSQIHHPNSSDDDSLAKQDVAKHFDTLAQVLDNRATEYLIRNFELE